MHIEELSKFCRAKGFVAPTAELYGGQSGFFDFGPLGVELKRNIIQHWWHSHVTAREDVVGMDGAIITHPDVWKASGHTSNFADSMLTTKKTKTRVRADLFIEEQLGISSAKLTLHEIQALLQKHNLTHNGEEFETPSEFNLMFQTTIGASKDSNNVAYLRPETAQLIFTNFLFAQETGRMKIPFGIAQVGKSFRNEISPRDFLFRCREFEQMEIEFFIHPTQLMFSTHSSLSDDFLDRFASLDFSVLTKEQQENDEKQTISMNIQQLSKQMHQWQAYWIAIHYQWFIRLGVQPKRLRLRQHITHEKAHYARDTWDLEYEFPFGWKEIAGFAHRGSYDLKQHSQALKKDLSVIDDNTQERFMPEVIEPSLGVERALLVFLFEAYTVDKEREQTILKLHPSLAPYKVGIFALVNNKPELVAKAKEIRKQLLAHNLSVFYDGASGSVGKKYARQDELGTPWCVTVDFESLEDHKVTVRNRDTTAQERVAVDTLPQYFLSQLYNSTDE